MSNEPDDKQRYTLKRREFLSAAAVPVAAALAPAALLAQQRSSTSTAGTDRIRVGIIGAGGIVSSVHVPGLKRQPGVEIVAVANRSLESSRRAAAELGIPNAYANWEELLAAGGLDAVLIGTWPYMHRTITLAALDEGLHVLCQARMANNTAEAREMLAASRRHPDRVCQLVPTSGSYRIDRALQRLLARALRRRRALRRGADAATRLRELRRRARLAPRPRVQRHQRAERRRHVRVGDALARLG